MRTNWIDRKRTIFAGALLLPLMTASVAHAQGATSGQSAAPDDEGLRDIVVTGTKLGAQSLQKTPVAVSVVDSQLLEKQSLSTVQDIANYVPNLTVSRATNQAIIYLRGIGSTNAGAGSDPSVTQQVDGVYIARPTAQIGDFIDVDRIEVLRGPQGTLYGRNAVGGTINIISRKPSTDFTGKFRAGYGKYNAKTFEGYLSGPLSGDTLTASISGTYRGHDAYFNNVVAGVPDVGSANRYGGRIQLRYASDANLDFTLRADYSRMDETMESYDHLITALPYASPLANALVGSYGDVAINTNQALDAKTGGISLEVNYLLGGGFSLKSITAWRSLNTLLFNDNDGGDLQVQSLQVAEKQQQVTQEFNLTYRSDKFSAVAGAFFFGDKDFQKNTAQIPVSVFTPPPRAAQPSAQPTVRTRSYAAFLQMSYELAEGLHATGGIRYTTETKSFAQNFTRTSLNPATLGVSAPGFPVVFNDQRTDHAFTPKFGLDYQVAPDVLLYASATRGFKSGGYNNAADVQATASFAPETLWAYEAGAKTQFFDRKVRINLSGFIYDYKDLQVRNLIGPGRATIINATSARIKGLELETLFKPIPQLQLSANLAYLDTRYLDFPKASIASAYAALIPNQTCTGAGPTLLCTYNATGNRLEATPEWSGVFGLDYSQQVGSNLGLDVHVDYAWRSSATFDASQIAVSRQKAYGLLNASIGIGPDTGWKVEAFVKNATDTKYYQVIAGNGIATGGIVGDPRTYGVRVGFSF
jgi:iron complex outermembrane recepter protein